MPPSEKQIIYELSNSLSATTDLVKSLLGEIRDNAVFLAVFREKLNNITDDIEDLSHLVRGNNGTQSVMVRVAALEQLTKDLVTQIGAAQNTIGDVKDAVEKDEQEEKTKQQYDREKIMAKLKIAAFVAPGLVSLAVIIIKTFL